MSLTFILLFIVIIMLCGGEQIDKHEMKIFSTKIASDENR